MRKHILFFVLSLFSGGCEWFVDVEYGFDVRNNSKRTIFVLPGYFPDMLLPELKPELIEIGPGKTRTVFDYDVGDEKFERLETERLTLFVLDGETVKNKSWGDLRKDNDILKIYKFNRQEKTEMGGGIDYP